MTKQSVYFEIWNDDHYLTKQETAMLAMDQWGKHIAIQYSHYLLKRILPNIEDIPNDEAHILFDKWYETQPK